MFPFFTSANKYGILNVNCLRVFSFITSE
jgi:hypothetical protein